MIDHLRLVYLKQNKIIDYAFIGLKFGYSKSIYERTNEATEKICKIMQIIIIHIAVPGFVLPKAFYCFFLYFATDLGPDAFELPFPTW